MGPRWRMLWYLEKKGGEREKGIYIDRKGVKDSKRKKKDTERETRTERECEGDKGGMWERKER